MITQRSKVRASECSSSACMYSLPFLPFLLPLRWVYEAILPKYGCHLKHLHVVTYKIKCTKYFDIVLQLTWEQILYAPTVQI